MHVEWFDDKCQTDSGEFAWLLDSILVSGHSYHMFVHKVLLWTFFPEFSDCLNRILHDDVDNKVTVLHFIYEQLYEQLSILFVGKKSTILLGV